jgi:hypothetical protein
VDDMSAQPIAPTDLDAMVEQSTWVVYGRNPYADTPTEVLADTIEGQWERGEPFTPEIVFEALNRAFDADELRARLDE